MHYFFSFKLHRSDCVAQAYADLRREHFTKIPAHELPFGRPGVAGMLLGIEHPDEALRYFIDRLTTRGYRVESAAVCPLGGLRVANDGDPTPYLPGGELQTTLAAGEAKTWFRRQPTGAQRESERPP